MSILLQRRMTLHWLLWHLKVKDKLSAFVESRYCFYLCRLRKCCIDRGIFFLSSCFYLYLSCFKTSRSKLNCCFKSLTLQRPSFNQEILSTKSFQKVCSGGGPMTFLFLEAFESMVLLTPDNHCQGQIVTDNIIIYNIPSTWILISLTFTCVMSRFYVNVLKYRTEYIDISGEELFSFFNQVCAIYVCRTISSSVMDFNRASNWTH